MFRPKTVIARAAYCTIMCNQIGKASIMIHTLVNEKHGSAPAVGSCRLACCASRALLVYTMVALHNVTDRSKGHANVHDLSKTTLSSKQMVRHGVAPSVMLDTFSRHLHQIKGQISSGSKSCFQLAALLLSALRSSSKTRASN